MKNIVLITFDSLRADHCGYCGYNRNTTPNMDELAKQGVAFTNAVSPASRTNPSMAGIFTGEPLLTRGKVSNSQHSKYHLRRYGTIAENLHEDGYTTAAFCPNAYSSRYYGFDRGFDKFEDFLFNTKEYQKLFDKHITDSNIYTLFRNLRNLIRKEEAFRSWDTYIDDMVEWANKQEKPYFMWGFSLDTHFPYIIPSENRIWSNAWKTYYYNWKCNNLLDEYDIDISESVIQGITDIYDDSIHYGDQLIGELRKRLGDDTVFIMCADHGEALGERGLYGHFYPSLYEENIHVPLVIGGIDSSKQIDQPTSLTMLPEIIEKIADGEELNASGSDYALSTTYDGRRNRNLISIKTRDYKYHLSNESEGDTFEKGYQMRNVDVETEDHTIENNHMNSLLGDLAHQRSNTESEQLEIRRTTKKLKNKL